MAQEKVKSKIPQDQIKSTPQSDQQEQASQNVSNVADDTNVVTRIKPVYPSWPNSKPGPRAVPPPPGTRPINALRPEQVCEIGYNQATGEPGVDSPLRSLPDPELADLVSFDQKPKTGQETLHKGKKRL